MSCGVRQMIVDRELMERVLDVKDRAEENKEVLEIVGVTKMWNTALAMSDEELVVCTLVALYKCPDMVFAAMAHDRSELLRKGKQDEGV